MKSAINTFIQLKEQISGNISLSTLRSAVEQNSWFSAHEIRMAISAICRTMLPMSELERWSKEYNTASKKAPQKVLIVMAGNIPLVGFFDLLCVIMAGDIAIVKPSHKDRVLMEWIIGELKAIDYEIPIYIVKNDNNLEIDKVIATGSESAVNYFRERYPDTPTLLRGTRHSVAIVRDLEDIAGLERDIYTYSGLGCRNVSMIFVPMDYDLCKIPTYETGQKYINNYLQNRAILTISGAEFTDNGVSCFVESSEFPPQISTIAIQRYSDIEQVRGWIGTHEDEIQCIVATKESINHPRRVGFGEAQFPTLWDYADGVDTMNFLL